jgi:hypothetical protein
VIKDSVLARLPGALPDLKLCMTRLTTNARPRATTCLMEVLAHR